MLYFFGRVLTFRAKMRATYSTVVRIFRVPTRSTFGASRTFRCIGLSIRGRTRRWTRKNGKTKIGHGKKVRGRDEDTTEKKRNIGGVIHMSYTSMFKTSVVDALLALIIMTIYS